MFTNAPRSRYPDTAAARRFMRLSGPRGELDALQCTPPNCSGEEANADAGGQASSALTPTLSQNPKAGSRVLINSWTIHPWSLSHSFAAAFVCVAPLQPRLEVVRSASRSEGAEHSRQGSGGQSLMRRHSFS